MIQENSTSGAGTIDMVSVADDAWIDAATDSSMSDTGVINDEGTGDAAIINDATAVNAESTDDAAAINADSTGDAASESDQSSPADADGLTDDELIMEIEEIEEIEEVEEADAIEVASFSAAPDATVYSDLSKALGYVRNQAMLRENDISLYVTRAVIEKLDFDNISDITAHTGDPKGGDYLYYALSSKSVSAGEQADGSWLVNYHFEYYDTKEQEAAIDSEIQKLISSLKLNSSKKSDYEKVKAIYQYITANVNYDFAALGQNVHMTKFCAYGSVVEHLAVCQGYCSMFYRLALEAGIDCRIINSNQLNHTWNIVKLDGIYYLVDSTWDTGLSEFSYFLKGSLDFSSHDNTDDNFQDASFAKKYPLADLQYGSTSLKSLGTAPDFTMITSDNQTISTSAKNKRAKVLVFYLSGFENTQTLAESLSGKKFAGVDIVFANANKQYDEQKTALSELGKRLPTGGSVIYTFSSNNADALSEFERVAGIADPNGYIYSPTVFLINAKNQIIYASHSAPGNLETIIQKYLVNNSAPSYKAEGTASGICGQNAVWSYSKGTLQISGLGALYDNLFTPTSIGWLGDQITSSFSLNTVNCKDVKKLIIGDGITGIGSNILCIFPNLQTIWFQGKVPTIAGGNTLPSSVTIRYPSSNKTWTASARKKISSGATWIAVDAKGNAAVSAPKKTSISSLTNTAKGVQITWKKSSKASGYYVYRGNTKIATISSASKVTYTDTKAKTNNKKYTYKVIAFTKSGSTIAQATASAAKSCYYVSVPTCSSAKNTAKKAMTVKWKKNSTASGYEIQYSQSKNFASGNKTVTIKKASTLSTVIKKLTSKKTYYVRIRAYKTAGGTKYYSAWCTAKSVKIKK
jgi:hypothetical protein